jgi:hypothetical protein
MASSSTPQEPQSPRPTLVVRVPERLRLRVALLAPGNVELNVQHGELLVTVHVHQRITPLEISATATAEQRARRRAAGLRSWLETLRRMRPLNLPAGDCFRLRLAGVTNALLDALLRVDEARRAELVAALVAEGRAAQQEGGRRSAAPRSARADEPLAEVADTPLLRRHAADLSRISEPARVLFVQCLLEMRTADDAAGDATHNESA